MTKNYHDQHQRPLTSKQILFCQKVLEGLNLSDAYRAAFSAANMKPATVNRAAKELMDNPKIATRIGELRGAVTAAVVKRAAHTLEAAMDEAGVLLKDAQALGQIGAGVAAATLRAKLSGHLSDRKEERKGPLDDTEVAILLEMRDELRERLRRAQEAAELERASVATVPEAPAPVRRVIG